MLDFYQHTTELALNRSTALPTGRANPIVQTVDMSFADAPGKSYVTACLQTATQLALGQAGGVLAACVLPSMPL